MTTPDIPIVLAGDDYDCFDCMGEISEGGECGAADVGAYAVLVCLDCRTARLNEGDI